MDLENSNKLLIRKYINQDCTLGEIEEIKVLMQHPDAARLFDEVLSENYTGLIAEQDIDQPLLDEQLQKFYQKIAEPFPLNEHDAVQTPTVTKVFNLKRYLPYAAIWAALVLGFAGYFMRFKKTQQVQTITMRELVNPYGQRSKIILPDSSEVFLGAGSKLIVPEKFTGNLREISLQGEAFFQITKNPLKPFIIHTGAVQTRVLGTSFKIESFKNRPFTVAVATGKVRVDRYLGNICTSLAILTPGQKVTYDQGKSTIEKVIINDIQSWKDGRQVFKNQTLKEITDVLERWYNVKVQYLDKKKVNERLSIIIKADQPLNDIMKVLSVTGHFKYSITAKNVSIN